MKYLFLLFLFVGCTKNPGTIEGVVTDLRYSLYNNENNEIVIYNEMYGSVTVYNSPYFAKIRHGQKILLGCTYVDSNFDKHCRVIVQEKNKDEQNKTHK